MRAAVVAVTSLGVLTGAGCSLSSHSDEEASSTKQVVVATHEAWADMLASRPPRELPEGQRRRAASAHRLPSHVAPRRAGMPFAERRRPDQPLGVDVIVPDMTYLFENASRRGRSKVKSRAWRSGGRTSRCRKRLRVLRLPRRPEPRARPLRQINPSGKISLFPKPETPL